MNIFFDLDGTLIDSRKRLYSLFCDITQSGLLSFDEYWNLKRSMINHKEILFKYFNYTESEYTSFQDKWISLIEDDKYLSLDEIFLFTDTVLQDMCKRKHTLYVVTARQYKENVIRQIRNLGIVKYFEDVLVTEARTTKIELIKNSNIILSDRDIFIGDTGMDINTAKSLKLFSVAVLTGFRNKVILNKYNPDLIEKDIRFLLTFNF